MEDVAAAAAAGGHRGHLQDGTHRSLPRDNVGRPLRLREVPLGRKEAGVSGLSNAALLLRVFCSISCKRGRTGRSGVAPFPSASKFSGLRGLRFFTSLD